MKRTASHSVISRIIPPPRATNSHRRRLPRSEHTILYGTAIVVEDIPASGHPPPMHPTAPESNHNFCRGDALWPCALAAMPTHKRRRDSGSALLGIQLYFLLLGAGGRRSNYCWSAAGNASAAPRCGKPQPVAAASPSGVASATTERCQQLARRPGTCRSRHTMP